MPKISFHKADRKLMLPALQSLKNFIPEIFSKESKFLHKLDYIFCSDEYLLEINRSHLQHDYYTDIITFDLSENAEQIVAEVYISLDRVRDNAEELNTQYETECLRVIFHGALHLCGYKDKTNMQKKKMRAKEDAYIELYLSQE